MFNSFQGLQGFPGKWKPDNLCIAVFIFCLSIRFAEYFLIETDKTAIGENILHKAVGIILLTAILKSLHLNMERYWISAERLPKRYFEGFVTGKRLLCYGIWIGIGNFNPARQSWAF